MRWVLLWSFLLLAAAAFLAVLGRRLFRQAKALASELSRASERMSAHSPSSLEQPRL